MTAQSFVQGSVFFFCQSFQCRHFCLADGTPRGVDDPLEGFIIVPDKKGQIGDCVADFHALVEPDTAVQLIGNPRRHQCLFHKTRYKARAVEDSDVTVLPPLHDSQPTDFRRDPFAFFFLGFCMKMEHVGPSLRHGEQILGNPVFIICNQRIGTAQNMLRGAVVLIQQNGFGAGEGFVEVHEDGHIRPAPFVNVLVGIPYDEQIFVNRSQGLNQPKLPFGGVLKLVHLNVVQAFCPFFTDFGEFIENLKGKGHQIVKIQTENFLLLCQIPADDLRFQRRDRIDGRSGRHIHGRKISSDHGVYIAFVGFEPVYCVQNLLKSGFVQLDFHFRVDFRQNPPLISFVKDGESPGIEQAVDIVPQYPYTETVVGSDEGVVVAVADEGTHTLFHLARRFVGEGNTEDVGRMNPGGLYQIAVAVGQGLGFAGARTCDNPHVSLRRRNCGKLTFIQFIEKLVHGVLPEMLFPILYHRFPARHNGILKICSDNLRFIPWILSEEKTYFVNIS